MQQLYALEREAREKEFSYEERKQLRQEKSVPVLQQMEQWMKQEIQKVLPQSAIGKAIAYTVSLWPRLVRYTEDGRTEIDNNLVENTIRPVAVGRKNYLFAGSHEGAARAALIYSLLGTCKQHNVNPFLWLRDTFICLPEAKPSELDRFLPQNRNSKSNGEISLKNQDR
jgi:hypothetical protein